MACRRINDHMAPYVTERIARAPVADGKAGQGRVLVLGLSF